MNDKKHTSISIDIYSPDGEIISRKGFNINRMGNIMIQYISRKGFNINRMENIMIQYISRQGFNINRWWYYTIMVAVRVLYAPRHIACRRESKE